MLTGQTKNTTYFSQKIMLRSGTTDLTIDNDKFPAGITRFTLYTADELPVAERLVFQNEQKNLHVSITTNKQKYLPRELVSLTIKTQDEKGNPVPSNLSLAVLDDKLWSFADDKQDHILSWLLMSAELKGKIEEPTFYFKKDEPNAQAALDLVMLTHGYRYFDYTPIVEEQGKLAFTPDQPQVISGTVLNAQQQPVKATVYLVQTVSGGKAVQYKTGDDGLFFFSQVTPNTNYYLFAHATDKHEKIAIQVLQNGMGFNPIRKRFDEKQEFVKDGKQIIGIGQLKELAKRVPGQQPNEKPANKMVMDFDKMDAVNLNDVVVMVYPKN
jgi:hypothetical protein